MDHRIICLAIVLLAIIAAPVAYFATVPEPVHTDKRAGVATNGTDRNHNPVEAGVDVQDEARADTDVQGEGVADEVDESRASRRDDPEEHDESTSDALIHEDDGEQDARWELMKKLSRRGIFAGFSHEHGSLPIVWVDDTFLSLDRRTKNNFLNVVWSYYAIEDDEFGMSDDGLYRFPVIVKSDDGTVTGREVGRYDPIDGFH